MKLLEIAGAGNNALAFNDWIESMDMDDVGASHWMQIGANFSKSGLRFVDRKWETAAGMWEGKNFTITIPRKSPRYDERNTLTIWDDDGELGEISVEKAATLDLRALELALDELQLARESLALLLK